MPIKTNILVVDDDKELTAILNEHLTEKGYEVTVASDGAKAVSLIHGKQYSAVFLDLKMPIINGFQTLAFLKSAFPQTKVIVLTAYADLNNTERCKKLGADAVLSKPYDLEEAFSTLDSLLQP